MIPISPKARHAALFLWTSCLLALLLPMPSLQGQGLKITLGGIEFKQYAIAIPDFKGSQGRSAAETLRKAFKITGVFRVIPPSAYLERPPQDGIEPGTFDFSPWRTVGAEGVLKASIQEVGGQLRIAFRFYEVGSGKLLQRDYNLPNAKNLRWYLFLFSQELYKYLTNEPGIFTSKVAAVRSFKGRQELWMMDFDGGGARQLTNNGSINALPSWSPNGRYIAYTSWKDRNPDIFVFDTSTGQSRKVSSMPGLNTGAAWSPDSTRIAFSASRGQDGMNIFVVGADGTGQRQLTAAKGWVRNLSPTWSPDGSQIAYVSTVYSSPQIFVMNADGSGARQVTTQGNYNQSPRWSPRGDWILFTGRDERAIFDLFIVSPTTREIRRLTQNQGSNIEAAWSPNGRNVVFVSTRAGVKKLFVMTWEGKHPFQITFLPGEFETPTWSPSLSR